MLYEVITSPSLFSQLQFKESLRIELPSVFCVKYRTCPVFGFRQLIPATSDDIQIFPERSSIRCVMGDSVIVVGSPVV